MDPLLERYLAETTNVAVIVTDSRGRIEWCNDGFWRLSGYTIEEAKGQTPGDLLQGPETDRATIARIREELAAERPFRTELLNYAKDGRTYWISFEVHPVFDAEGTLVNYVAFEYDVTGLKASELAAETRASRTDRLAVFARSVLAAGDPRSVIDSAGACLARGLGAGGWSVERDEAIGPRKSLRVVGEEILVGVDDGPDGGLGYRLVFDGPPPEDRDAEDFARSVSDLCAQALARLRAEGEAEKLRSELERRVEERTAALERLNADLGREIVERKDAERTARSAQEELRFILDEMSPVVVLLDGAGMLINVNNAARSFARTHGVSEAISSDGVDFVRALRVRGSRADAGVRTLADAVEAVRDRTRHSVVLQVDFGDGEEAYAYQTRVKRIDAEGLSRIVITLEDISESRRRERRVVEQTAALGHVARLETMGELAAAMAHELNQPLAAVSNYISGAGRLMRSKGIEDRTLLDAMERALVQARRAGEIIKRIRSFSRADASSRRVLSVNDVVAEAVELLREDARMRGVLVVAQLGNAVPPASIDPIQIEQVCINLLRNAMDAVSALPPERRVVTVSTRASEDQSSVIVGVSDRGGGIEQEKLDTLFDPFISSKRSGLGLGLAICRSLIESHGGRISARSTVGEGSAFEFRLPARTELRRSPGAGQAQTRPDTRSRVDLSAQQDDVVSGGTHGDGRNGRS